MQVSDGAKEVRFAGFGGQGVILMGIVLARAAALYDRRVDESGRTLRKFAIQTQSYGPSARGGHSKCDVKIATKEMHYPFVEVPDYLVILSKQAYSKYIHERKPDTRIILDPDLVPEMPKGEVYRIGATRAAEDMGTRIVANIVMLSALREISDIVTYEALEKALFEVVPKVTHELNTRALEAGARLGREALHATGKG